MESRYYLYSAEDFPRAKRPKGWTPEYIVFNGLQLGPIKAGEWFPIPARMSKKFHTDYLDKRGQTEIVHDDEFASHIREKWAARGVIILKESDYLNEELRAKAESESKEINLQFRRNAVEEYERQLQDRKVTGQGRLYPTPYEIECYELLGLPKPYSIESFKAERMPGEDAARRIADAITGAMAEAALRQANPDASMTQAADEVAAGMSRKRG